MAAGIAKQEEPLGHYNRKRNFKLTSEPAGELGADSGRLSFVIQKHWASRLHYDFRLELDGVMLSWALPKGLSFDPRDMRMAIHVEDHPVSYSSFEGTIPARQYGAGTVIVWDRGTWEPVGDPREGMKVGKILFHLHGEKLAGQWELVRISKPGELKQDQWMIFKKKGDAWARPLVDYDVIKALPDSVIAKPLGLVEAREPKGDAAPSPRHAGAADLSAAIPSSLPAALEPQLATLASAPPSGKDWLPETKFDGYRFLIRIDKGKAAFFTRGGHDWTSKVPSLAQGVEGLGIDSAWLDGEVVVLDEQGLPNFSLLQDALAKARNDATTLFLFDIPFAGGLDLRRVPLWARRAHLRQLVEDKQTERIRYSADFAAPAAQLLAAACALKLEGIMIKQADSPYVSGRTESWLKLKCSLRQEFVVIGFTDRSNAANEVGGLLLGYYDDDRLRYAGNVGTGWNSKTGRELHAALRELETKKSPVDASTVKPGRWSKRTAGSERWVRPEMVVEVSFAEWTADDHVRHGVFKGIRTDKPPGAIGRESAMVPASGSAAPGALLPAPNIKVSNPDRVIDTTSKLTKLDLFRYYESVAERIIPHLLNRPVSLVRAPEGISGELFFQKHPESRMPGLMVLDAALWPGHSALLSVSDATGLLSAAQMNTVEFHTWNSSVSNIDRPDRMIFDLDPGEGVTWAHLQEAALLTRAMLQELGLASWLKTSGGKGMHVVVPLEPDNDFAVVKEFSQAVVQHMAKVIPQRFVAKLGASNRIGKIFIDYLRNGHGQTTAAAFSARSRPGLGVSMPVSWDQLSSLKGGSQWTIATAREHLSFEKIDPWANYWTSGQSLKTAMERLDFKPVKKRSRAT